MSYYHRHPAACDCDLCYEQAAELAAEQEQAPRHTCQGNGSAMFCDACAAERAARGEPDPYIRRAAEQLAAEQAQVAPAVAGVVVRQAWDLTERAGHVFGLSVDCRDHDAFQALPAAVTFEGRTYGRSGWDSDKGTAYYRTDAAVALAAG